MLKALAGAATAVVHLVQKLYEAKEAIPSYHHQPHPPLAGTPPASNGDNKTIDLSEIKLEGVGPLTDEDGFSF